MSLALTANQLWSSAGTRALAPGRNASAKPVRARNSGTWAAHCAAIVGVIIRMQEPIQSAISPAKHPPWWGA